MLKWPGKSELLIQRLFEMARSQTESLIFLNEIESLLGVQRGNASEFARKIRAEFLIQMDRLLASTDIMLLLGATRCRWGLDAEVQRCFKK
jgi:vacuolar protein-sorting-associated protein 4